MARAAQTLPSQQIGTSCGIGISREFALMNSFNSPPLPNFVRLPRTSQFMANIINENASRPPSHSDPTTPKTPAPMADQLKTAPEELDDSQKRLPCLKDKYEEGLRSLRAELEANNKELEECRLQKEKDAKELREVHTELENLRQQKAGLSCENEALKQTVVELQKGKEDVDEKDAEAAKSLFEKLKAQCEDFQVRMRFLPCHQFLESVGYDTVKTLAELMNYNRELGEKISGLQESTDPRAKISSLIVLLLEHRKWELVMAQNLSEYITAFDLLKTIRKSDIATAHQKEALVIKGVEIRLRFWEHVKAVTNNIPREELNEEIVQAGNVAAHEANVAADVALFECGFLEGPDDLANFEKIYGHEHSICRAVLRNTPGYSTLLESEATIRWKVSENSRVKISAAWEEWSNLCEGLWNELYQVPGGTYAVTVVLQDPEGLKEDCQRLRALTSKILDMERSMTGRLRF
jgi:hypothetical protein